MDEKRFWDIIGFACDPNGSAPKWTEAVIEVLMQLDPEDVVRFDRWFYERTDELYTRDQWAVADLVNGGVTDQDFYFFRCWVVGMGKKVHDAFRRDPDSLADVVDPGEISYQSDSLAEGRAVWKRLGLNPAEYDRIRDELGERIQPELTGDDWNFEDAEEVRRRLPRLADLYIPEY